MNIADTLHDKPVSELDLSRYVTVAPDATVAETVETMNAAVRSVAFVVAGDELVGVFTQRDVLMRTLGDDDGCGRGMGEVMTGSPFTMRPTDSVADGMAIMTGKWVRSVPVVEEDGTLVGNFSFYAVMHLVSQLLSEKSSRYEPQLSAQHGLMFIDLSGLRTSPAATAISDDPLAAAVRQMRARPVGIVLVLDERDHVVGTLSEFDLQTKVACRGSDLDQIPVRQVMTAEPVTISMRSPVAEAVVTMARHEISHVGLIGESGRLVGVASFRDVADYFDSSLATLG